jgi:hypothetical protein
MFSNRRIQQSVSRKKLKRWSILCDEGDVKKVHFVKSEGKHYIKLKTNQLYPQPPFHSKDEPLF